MEQKPKLLVIDDELGPRESLRFLFKDLYDVTCASSVDQSLNLMTEIKPDCIISDIRMPDKNGLEGLREIRAIDENVSIIMLTGYGSLETAQQAIRYGANEYVKKPFDAQEMRALIKGHINRSQLKRRQSKAYQNLCELNHELQTKLDRKEHLATLGQASSEFIHDLRNPLTVISGYVSLLMGELNNATTPSSDPTLEYLEQLENSVKQCQKMSQNWREMATDEPLNYTLLSLNDLVQDISSMLKLIAADKNVAVRVHTLQDSIMVNGNSLQLFRALQNLCTNALEAVPADGSGTITLELTADQHNATIRIQDNGSGIPANKIDAVFSPYNSSRKQEGGMGLGLFISRKIIAQHKGTIELQNRAEGGICANITLPIVQQT